MLTLFTFLLLLSALLIIEAQGEKMNIEMSLPADMHQYFNMFRYMRKVLHDPEF